jgi:hypothetical protein
VCRRLKAPLITAIGALIGGAFYFQLIDTTSLPELYVLAGVAVACGVAFVLAREQGFVEAWIKPTWLLRSWRLVWRIPSDIGIVCWEALAQLVRPRPTRGVFRATAFAATEATPEHTGRRALAETVGSFAPNTIIVGVDAERGLLLVHQLRRQGPPGDLDVTRLG